MPAVLVDLYAVPVLVVALYLAELIGFQEISVTVELLFDPFLNRLVGLLGDLLFTHEVLLWALVGDFVCRNWDCLVAVLLLLVELYLLVVYVDFLDLVVFLRVFRFF